MQDMLLVDPIRAAGDAGWPDLPSAIAAGAARFHAAATAGTADGDVAVIDRRLRIRCASPALVAASFDAFRHRRLAGTDEPDLTILAWASQPEPWAAPMIARAAAVHPQPAAVTLLAGAVTALVQGPPAPSIQAIDLQHRIALSWTADDRPVAAWERCRPFAPIIQWWLADTPWQMVHGAAVAREDGGILLAGPGGAGKSTAALACLRAGWRYAGDDFVPIAAEPVPRVDAIFASARLRPDMADRFPELAALRIAPDPAAGDLTHDYLLADAVSAFAGFPVRAILLPRVSGARGTTVHAASRGEALRALAPSTLGLLKGDTRRSFDKVARFAESVPCFRLMLGSDIDDIPAAIDRAIDLAGAPVPGGRRP